MNMESPPAVNNGPLLSPSPSFPKDKGSSTKGDAYDYYRMVVGSPDPVEEITPNPTSNPALPTLTKPGYTITPSLTTLSYMSEADLAAVQNFSVERTGYGSVAWDDAVDVRGCNLDSIISIETTDVAGYDSEEAEATKPPVGSKLNRPAVITCCGVFTKDGGVNASEGARAKYERMIEKATKGMGADLLSYDAVGGVWKFRVHHFSRYALVDDDDGGDGDDDDGDKENDGNGSKNKDQGGDTLKPTTKDAAPVNSPNLRSPDEHRPLRESTPSTTTTKHTIPLTTPTTRTSRFSLSIIDDDGAMSTDGTTEEDSVTHLIDTPDQDIEAADNAYEMLTRSLQPGELPPPSTDISNNHHHPMEVEREELYFQDEGYVTSAYTSAHVVPPCPPPSRSSNEGSIGISALIARRCGVKTATSSGTDFGMRMGRSFRVGWRPDGTLVHPGSFEKNGCHQGKILVQSRPALSDVNLPPCEKKEEMCTGLLAVHLKHCQRVVTAEDGCPFFSLNPIVDPDDVDEIMEDEPVSILDGYTKEMNAMTTADETNHTAKLTAQALSLITILFQTIPHSNNHSNFQRKEAFSKWLQKINTHEASRDITTATSKNDALAAIFAALTSNDTPTAESISTSSGLVALSSLLTNPSLQACGDLMRQMEAWEDTGASGFCPTMLTRIFALMSRNLDLEEAVYRDAAAAGP